MLHTRTDNLYSQETEVRDQQDRVTDGGGSWVLILILTLSLCSFVSLGNPLKLKELSTP